MPCATSSFTQAIRKIVFNLFLKKKPWYFLFLLLKKPPFKFEANQETTPLVQAPLIDLI